MDWWEAALTGIVGLGGGGTIVAYMNRDKTIAEANSGEANARLADAQAESLAVTAVRDALREVRQNSSDKDKELLQMRQELADMRKDIKGLEDQGHRVQVALAAHGQWDILVVAQVRQINPDFPEPPPLYKFDEDFQDPKKKED